MESAASLFHPESELERCAREEREAADLLRLAQMDTTEEKYIELLEVLAENENNAVKGEISSLNNNLYEEAKIV